MLDPENEFRMTVIEWWWRGVVFR